MHPSVSIIIPTKNPGEQLLSLLKRINNQTYEGNVETIIIDSGSPEGILEQAANHGASIYRIHPDEYHHSRTRNSGAQRSSGEVLVYLVQDALPADSDWLDKLVSPIINDKASVVYARQVAFPDSKPVIRFFYEYFYPDSRKEIRDDYIGREREFYLDNIYISDVSAAMSKNTWRDIQFDKDVPMSEDKDFALRALRNGYSLMYNPSAIVYHSHEYSLVSLFQRRFQDGAAFSSIAGSGKANFGTRGFQFLLYEIRYLRENNNTLWIPYAIVYNTIYLIAFKMGEMYTRYDNEN